MKNKIMTKQNKNIESNRKAYGFPAGYSAVCNITATSYQYTGVIHGNAVILHRELPCTQNNMSATVRNIHVTYLQLPDSGKHTAGTGRYLHGILICAYALYRTLPAILRYFPVKLFHAGVSQELSPETKIGSSVCMNHMSESISRIFETFKCVPAILKGLLKTFRQYPACPVQLLKSKGSFPVCNREMFLDNSGIPVEDRGISEDIRRMIIIPVTLPAGGRRSPVRHRYFPLAHRVTEKQDI
jgi:hypothetical protein